MRVHLKRSMGSAFVIVGLLASGTVARASHAEPTSVGALAPGDSVLWNGPFIERSGVAHREQDSVLCQGTAGTMWGCFGGNLLISWVPKQACDVTYECLDYTLDLAAGGSALRVALDHPSGRDAIWFDILRPDGTSASSDPLDADPVNLAYGYGANFPGGLSGNAIIEEPAAGRWTIRVLAYDVVASGFRMRARLDAPPHGPGNGPVRPLLPNLQTIPPFEVGFTGCQLSEIQQYGAQRCLRISTGPGNAGDGPLDLRIPADGDRMSGTQYQRVYYSDGSTVDRPAGTYEFHAQHLHYHHSATGDFELYRVDDTSTGSMHKASSGPKIGFCMGDYLIVDWSAFNEDLQGSGNGDCAGIPGADAATTHMGLTRGWADIYTYSVEANYIEFGQNPDGLYVLRATADPNNDILETSDDDNTSYTYVRVTGDQIQVLERGVGQSPWDEHKILVNDTRRPNP